MRLCLLERNSVPFYSAKYLHHTQIIIIKRFHLIVIESLFSAALSSLVDWMCNGRVALIDRVQCTNCKTALNTRLHNIQFVGKCTGEKMRVLSVQSTNHECWRRPCYLQTSRGCVWQFIRENKKLAMIWINPQFTIYICIFAPRRCHGNPAISHIPS